MQPLLLVCVALLGFAVADLSLSSTALVQERHYYESTVGHAAQVVLRKLSQEKEVTVGSRISKVDMEDTQVAESVLYSVNLQMDVGEARGLNYDLQFVQPLSSWRPIRSRQTKPLPKALPSSSHTSRRNTRGVAEHGSSPFYNPPEISLTLTGPMELYLPDASTELVVKTPRYVDVGYVDRIIIQEGVNVTLVGSAELRLRDTLNLHPDISIDENRLQITSKEAPKLNIYGSHIEIRNEDGEELKVQKKYSTVLTVSSATETPVVKTGLAQLEIPWNDSRVESIKQALKQISETHESSFLPNVRKLNSGSSIEAVVSFLIPLEVEDSVTGTSSKWDVVVVKGSNHKEAQVISMEKQKVHNQVSFSNEIVINQTLPEALANLNTYLHDQGRML